MKISPKLNSPSTACGESFAPFLPDEVDIDDDEEEEDEKEAGRRSDSECDCRRRRSPPPPPPFLPLPWPLALPYLTASMKGFPTPVTLLAVR